ncbi:phage major tail protein [Escherichia coli]|nr:phage major tail protein [Escherichia coli]
MGLFTTRQLLVIPNKSEISCAVSGAVFPPYGEFPYRRGDAGQNYRKNAGAPSLPVVEGKCCVIAVVKPACYSGLRQAETRIPLEPVKGAGTTLWVYNGQGDAYANPLSDDDWQRLAKVKDLTPGEMTAESYDDNYLDDEDADWTATGQGQKSAGDTSFTLAWKPGEEGQKGLIGWFESGDVRAYKIRFPNGTVDVFRGWVSSIGKAVTAKEVITRTVKVTNVGKPSVAEERSKITPVSAIKVTPTSGTVAKGKTTTLTVSFEPESATDKTFRAVSADPSKATISVKDMTITVNGVATGKVQIPVVSGNGQFAAVAEVTVTEAGAAG